MLCRYKKKHDISIRNLNIFGTLKYGIYAGKSSYLLFQNRNVLLAEGESIEIRCHSQGIVITNLSIPRWSHDLYFDNCTLNGLIEQGIEAYNSYNI